MQFHVAIFSLLISLAMAVPFDAHDSSTTIYNSELKSALRGGVHRRRRRHRRTTETTMMMVPEPIQNVEPYTMQTFTVYDFQYNTLLLSDKTIDLQGYASTITAYAILWDRKSSGGMIQDSLNTGTNLHVSCTTQLSLAGVDMTGAGSSNTGNVKMSSANKDIFVETYVDLHAPLKTKRKKKGGGLDLEAKRGNIWVGDSIDSSGFFPGPIRVNAGKSVFVGGDIRGRAGSGRTVPLKSSRIVLHGEGGNVTVNGSILASVSGYVEIEAHDDATVKGDIELATKNPRVRGPGQVKISAHRGNVDIAGDIKAGRITLGAINGAITVGGSIRTTKDISNGGISMEASDGIYLKGGLSIANGISVYLKSPAGVYISGLLELPQPVTTDEVYGFRVVTSNVTYDETANSHLKENGGTYGIVTFAGPSGYFLVPSTP